MHFSIEFFVNHNYNSSMRARKAESMIETLVAITVIVISTVAALSLMRTAISSNRVIEEKVIAINLAVEGLDAVKNIRDTNYLRFAGHAEECWNCINANVGDDCTRALTMAPGSSYYLIRELSVEPFMEWKLMTVTAPANGNLNLYNVDYDRDSQIDTTIYAQAGITRAGFTVLEDAPFKRLISFENVGTAGDAVRVTATVSWEESGVTKEISLTSVVSNVY